MENLKTRLLEFISYTQFGQTKFELTVGIARGIVSKINDNISSKTLNRISETYPELNTLWLLTGEGEMLKSQELQNYPVISETKGIPFYDIDVTASIVESFSDVQETAAYYIDYPAFSDCTAAFPVYGDSMEPDFSSGQTILVKPVNNINSMLWGEPYLVITNANCDNLRTIKNVYISDNRKHFILRATNPRYKGDTLIPCEDVIKIFLVKGSVNRRQF